MVGVLWKNLLQSFCIQKRLAQRMAYPVSFKRWNQLTGPNSCRSLLQIRDQLDFIVGQRISEMMNIGNEIFDLCNDHREMPSLKQAGPLQDNCELA